MKHICETVYLQGGNGENEDAFVTNKETAVFAAIDGATGLGGASGKLAAFLVKKSLEEVKKEESLIQGLQRANELIASQLVMETGDQYTAELPKEKRSTCGVAAIKLNGNRLEYVHAGDCMIFIEYANNDIRHVTYDHLAKLDTAAINYFHEILTSKIAHKENPEAENEEHTALILQEARQQALPLIIENRRQLNTPYGYGIIDGSPEALQFLDFGQLSMQDARQILLVSDGLQLPIQKADGPASWDQTAAFAFRHGLQALAEEVVRLEKSDTACILYPRLKVSDDKTGILVKLE